MEVLWLSECNKERWCIYIVDEYLLKRTTWDTKIIRVIYIGNNETTCKPSDDKVDGNTNLRQPFTMCLWAVWWLRYGWYALPGTQQPLGVMSSWRVRSLWKITRRLCVGNLLNDFFFFCWHWRSRNDVSAKSR